MLSNNTMTYQEFKKEFLHIQSTSPTYRLGQNFISNFIKREDNTTDFSRLWNEECNDRAEKMIFRLIDQLQWDYTLLVRVR
jgi:hypothetical protein